MLKLIYSKSEPHPESSMTEEERKEHEKYLQEVEDCGHLGCAIAKSSYEKLQPLHKAVIPLHIRPVQNDFLYWLSERVKPVKIPDSQNRSPRYWCGFSFTKRPMLFIAYDSPSYLCILRKNDLHLALKQIERYPLEELIEIWLGNL